MEKDPGAAGQSIIDRYGAARKPQLVSDLEVCVYELVARPVTSEEGTRLR